MSKEISDNLIDEILEEVQFERKLYEVIGKTDQYDVIEINTQLQPTTAEEIQQKAFEKQCEKSNIKIIYRIVYPKYTVVVAKDSLDKVGILPNDGASEWFC